jgi:hypothetical protein
MELQHIFLARFAEATPDGLLTVVGGPLSRLEADRFPTSIAFLYLPVHMRLTVSEAKGPHSCAVARELPNGQREQIGSPFDMIKMPAEARPEYGPDGKVGVSVNTWLVNLYFPEPGIYTYHFEVDGKSLGAAKLLVEAKLAGG